MCGTTKLPREILKDFADLSVEPEILATGIKVINLLAPLTGATRPA